MAHSEKAMKQRQEETHKVGVRQFRDNFAKYIDNKEPLAVTKHGETVGYYIPTKTSPTEHELNALVVATTKMKKLLKDTKLGENSLVKEFRQLRKKSK